MFETRHIFKSVKSILIGYRNKSAYLCHSEKYNPKFKVGNVDVYLVSSIVGALYLGRHNLK